MIIFLQEDNGCTSTPNYAQKCVGGWVSEGEEETLTHPHPHRHPHPPHPYKHRTVSDYYSIDK
jgi:hypothetical protein